MMFVRYLSSLNFSPLGFAILIGLNIQFAQAEINLKQVETDINILASDEMQGRQVFTPAIDKAADYIAQRFDEIGLEPLSGLSSFKQEFSIYQVSSKSASIEINGEIIAEENYTWLSVHENKSWNNVTELEVKFISQKDDFRQAIGTINQSGKDTLVIVDAKHKAMFARYQSYFSKAKSRMEINLGPSLILVVNPTTKVKSVKINLNTSSSKKSLTNVIGVLKAQTLNTASQKSENVIFSAHYDHLGMKEADKSTVDKKNTKQTKEFDLIFNGADDDASGTVAVINLASHFANQNNRKRDLIFVAFTAEEIGGYGSQYFSKQINANTIVAMINIEMIGKPSKFGAGEFWMTGFERSNLAQIINTKLKKSGFKMYQDPYPKQRLFYRSDNATLARLGVPAHSFSTDKIDQDPHYHKASDEVKTLDIKSMVEVINKLSIATEPLVSGNAKPTRLDTSKVQKKGSFF